MFKSNSISVVSIVLNSFINDSRVLKEARTLQKDKYDVTVVALHEPPLAERELIEGFSVDRIILTSRSWPRNTPFRLLKYIEFIVRVIKRYHNRDIIHCHDLNALPIGVIIKKIFNRKAFIVYDAHEYETETNGLKGFRKKAVKILEKILIKQADAIITVSDSIAIEYSRLYQIKKPFLVLNTPPYREFSKQNLFREKFKILDTQRIFLYQGNLSKGRGLEILLEAFSSLKTHKNVIIFMGYGPLEDIIKESATSSGNIFFNNAVSPEDVLNYTASADYGISFVEDICLSYRYSLPNKIFEYIMAGLPVICSNLPEMKKLIESKSLGISAESITKQGISRAIEEITLQNNDPRRECLNKVRQQYCWETQEKVLLKVYEGLHD